ALQPVIRSQPTNQTIMGGGAVTFAVAASGLPPLRYQWFFNDTNTPVSGATNSFLVLTNLQPSQAGSYFVQVSDPFATILSSNALLNVAVTPNITSQPNSQ